MTQPLLAGLARAGQCVELLLTLGASIDAARVHRTYGAHIRLTTPGTLEDWLDARQTPVLLATREHLAVVNDCLVSWPRTGGTA